MRVIKMAVNKMNMFLFGFDGNSKLSSPGQNGINGPKGHIFS